MVPKSTIPTILVLTIACMLLRNPIATPQHIWGQAFVQRHRVSTGVRVPQRTSVMPAILPYADEQRAPPMLAPPGPGAEILPAPGSSYAQDDAEIEMDPEESQESGSDEPEGMVPRQWQAMMVSVEGKLSAPDPVEAHMSDSDESDSSDGAPEASGNKIIKEILSLKALAKELAAFLKQDDQLGAHAVQERMKTIIQVLSGMRVCGICFIREPSKAALSEISETWYGGRKNGMRKCGCCGRQAARESRTGCHFAQMSLSLKVRGLALLHLAKKQVPATRCTRAKGDAKAVRKGVRQCKQAKHLGQGKGPKWLHKQQSVAALTGQLLRLHERLACEPELQGLSEAVQQCLEFVGVF